MESEDLLASAVEIERHVGTEGWDQPTLLFALVETERIRADQPQLAERLGLGEGGPALTTFEQEAPPDDEDLEVFLGRIEWPSEVDGAALVVERLVLPPDAEAQLASAPDLVRAARAHPAARDVRIVVAVDRSGCAACVLRLRAEDGGDDELATGPDLVPGLVSALAATFDLG